MFDNNKNEIDSGLALPLMESFYTIQGEGYFSGIPSYFLRIGGCDVGCHWCDVKESWDAELHPLTKIEDILKELDHNICDNVVITGGEPLMYNLEPLTNLLKKNNFKINLETSGAYPLTGTFDWICLSPKKNTDVINDFYKDCNELKVIIQNNHDFKWAEIQRNKLKRGCFMYLQPEWSKSKIILPRIIDYVKNNTKWKISLQTQKYMNIP